MIVQITIKTEILYLDYMVHFNVTDPFTTKANLVFNITDLVSYINKKNNNDMFIEGTIINSNIIFYLLISFSKL